MVYYLFLHFLDEKDDGEYCGRENSDHGKDAETNNACCDGCGGAYEEYGHKEEELEYLPGDAEYRFDNAERFCDDSCDPADESDGHGYVVGNEIGRIAGVCDEHCDGGQDGKEVADKADGCPDRYKGIIFGFFLFI